MSKDGDGGRGTTLQDELLDDLRRAGPESSPPPPVERPSSAAKPDQDLTPTFEIRVTPLRWSWLKLRAGRAGWTLSAGPVRISVRGIGR